MDSVQERWMHDSKQFIYMVFTVLSVYRLCVNTLRLENNREICFANLISRQRFSNWSRAIFSMCICLRIGFYFSTWLCVQYWRDLFCVDPAIYLCVYGFRGLKYISCHIYHPICDVTQYSSTNCITFWTYQLVAPIWITDLNHAILVT